MYNALTKLNDGIFKVYKVIMMLLLCIMSIWVFLEVVFREAGVSVPWIEEFTIYAFSWLTYFGAANVLRNDGHLSVTAVTGLIKNKTVKKVVALISYIIVFVFVLVVARYSVTLVQKYFKSGSTATNLRWVKMAWIFLQIPINYVVYALFELEKIWGTINGKKEVQ
jgi:TRAP-type C4-dicarboxylate transport system permease small subunit